MASSVHPSRAGFVCVTILAASLCVPARAAEFAGGTGEPDDPYQIATAGQLLSLGTDPNLQGKHFILVADIDLDPNLPDSKLLENGLTLSSGSLDGCGHRILNLGGRMAVEETRRDGTVYYRDRYGSSLFELIGADAVVCNLYLKGTMLRGPAMLAGENRGLIMGCSAEGSVSDDSPKSSIGRSVGGLVKKNTGIIIGCRVTADIVGLDQDRSPGASAGGLTLENAGTILGCAVGGTVVGTRAAGLVISNAGTIAYSGTACSVTGNNGGGGLVGSNSGTIRWCRSIGDVTSSEGWAGGLVATNSGTISYCCATGDVWAAGAGGLVGSNAGTISQCYATGHGGGALGGENEWHGTISNCYALASQAGPAPDDGFTILLTDAQMRRQESFVGWDFGGTSLDGTLDHWTMPEEGGYPLVTAIDASACAGGGTADDPYLVETAQQFMAIACEPQARYRLEADIDLAGESFSPSIIPVFLGYLDGAGYSVSNLTLTGGQDVGLLGMTYPEAEVVDLHLQGIHIETTGDEQQRIGTLAACNRGTVTDCTASVTTRVLGGRSTYYVAGLIGVNEGGQVHRCFARLALVYQLVASRGSLYDYAGLVGHNTGIVSQCHASSYTNSEVSRFGGLVGRNHGSIMDCYADGYIRGNRVGGLVQSNGGSIANCYATATVLGVLPAGGLVAEDKEGIISSSYFLGESDGGGPDNGLGVALTDAAMRQQTSFVGWDFDDVWTICEGVDYPRLRWEGTACEQ